MSGDDDRDGDIQQLYDRFLELARQPSPDGAALVDEILLHEFSLTKMRSACTALLRSRNAPSSLRDDLQQEAIVIVSQRFRSRKQPFQANGADLFAGWLWKTWFFACHQAWWRQNKKMPGLLARLVDELTCKPWDPLQQGSLWDRLLEAIDQLQESTLQDAMIDWATGLTLTESSRLRSNAVSTVSDRRARALQQIQQILKIDDWPSAAW